MTRALLVLLSSAGLLAAAASAPAQVRSFRPIATFNVPNGGAAEIVAVTPAGNMMIYTDAVLRRIGFVSIASPNNPLLIGTLPIDDGEPTSVDVTADGAYAIAVVKGSGAGTLISIRLSDRRIVGAVPLNGEPDSIDLTTINGQTVAVVAIENEESPAVPGNVAVVAFDPAAPAGASVAYVLANPSGDLAGFGLLFETDPEPEFVTIHHGLRQAAITLQENNGILIVDISNPLNPTIVSVFSTGVVGDRLADLTEDDQIVFAQLYPSDAPPSMVRGARTPDAIGWNEAGTRLYTADEGEANFTGGRGFSAHMPTGGVAWDDGGELERMAVQFGYYPDDRSANKGIETEGLAVARFGTSEFVFVTSERGLFVAVYRIAGDTPEFVQLLPTGIGPESARPVPGRHLLVIANEGDDFGGSISIFAGVAGLFEGTPWQPTLQSSGVHVPWSALSGLTGDFANERVLYTVSDSALTPSIFRIDLTGPRALISEMTRVNAPNLDLEGVAIDTSIFATPGQMAFWVASEGAPPARQNLILRVLADGTVTHTIPLPPAVAATITSNGYEGLSVSRDGRSILVAIQRALTGDRPTTSGRIHTRIGRYTLQTAAWEFFLYPLEQAPPARPDLGAAAPWVALSEITTAGRTLLGSDIYAVIERDNRWAGLAQTKLVCFFALDGLVSFGEGVIPTGTTDDQLRIARHVVTKSCYDIGAPFVPHEKIEGFHVTRTGQWWAVRDNDGAGHSPLIRLR